MGKFKGFYLLLFSVLLCALIMAGQIVHAVETFQNNLLKIDLYHSSLGGVKVTLYTNKPYNESVSINKKNDFEYVILMPETANSLTAKPTLKTVSDIIKNIDVKTQQYENQVKGYTKITILTTKPIEITPQVQTLNVSDYQMSEKDYNDLIAQTAKKQTTKTIQKLNPTQKKTFAPRPTQKPTVVYTKTQTLVQKKVEKKKALPQKVIAEPKLKTKPKTIEAVVPAVKTKPQKIEQPKTTQKVETQVKTVIPQTIVPAIKPVQPIRKFERYKHKIKNIVKNHFGSNFYTIIGLALIPIIFLLLILKVAGKTAGKIRQQKSNFAENLKEAPNPVIHPVTDYSEKINDDMTWKEKFQTYVDTTTPPISAPTDEVVGANQIQNADANPQENINQESVSSQELDDLFGADSLLNNDENAKFEESPKISRENSSLDELNEIMTQDELDEDISIEALFDEDNYEYVENISEENIAEDYSPKANQYFEPPIIEEEQEESVNQNQDKFVQSEFVIDDERGFYLVDFENTTALVGHIAEEIFVLKRFDEKVSDVLQARFNEKKGNAVNYMTRVGNFKGIVEVTPQKMNLLIVL